MRISPKTNRAFTLIELLVVLAVIAVFMTILGVALTHGDRAAAVQSGQRTLSGLMTAARAQAILNQADTRLIVHFDPPGGGDDEKQRRFLRFAAIVVEREDADGNDYWSPIDDGVFLPRGVYFVPPWDYELPENAGSGPDSALLNQVMSMGDSDDFWARRARSVVELYLMRFAFGHRYDLDQNPPTGAEHYYFYIEFNSRGMMETETEINGRDWERRLVLAPGRMTGRLPEFEEDGYSAARGGMIRRNGAFILVNNPASFPSYSDNE